MSRNPLVNHEAKVKELRDEYRNNVNNYDDRTKQKLIDEIYHHERKVEEIKRMIQAGVKFRK